MSSKRIRRTAPRKTQQNAKEKAYYLERCHYSYEHMLHMMFCDPEFDLHCRKSKQICVLSYCMYYYGITVQQLCATGITPAAKPECELVFLNRLVREDVLEVDKSIQPGENQNVYFLTQKGADFVEQRLNALSGTPVAGKHIDKNAVHEIRKRFDSFTAPTNISHFVAARDLHAFMLSSVKDTRFHFQLAWDLTGLCSICMRKSLHCSQTVCMRVPSFSLMRFLPDQASRTGSRRFPGRRSLLMRIRTRKIQREITRKKKSRKALRDMTGIQIPAPRAAVETQMGKTTAG